MVKWPEIIHDPDVSAAQSEDLYSLEIDVSPYGEDIDYLIKTHDQGEAYLQGIARQLAEQEVSEDEEATPTVRNLRLVNFPSFYRRDIKQIGTEDLNTFVSIKGVVRVRHRKKQRLLKAAYKDLRCGHITYVDQGRFQKYPPQTCEFCGKTAGVTRFSPVIEKGTFIDAQKISVQERPEDLAAGEDPEVLTCYIEDDLVNTVKPGQVVILNGWIKPVDKQKKSTVEQTMMDIYMDVNSIEVLDTSFDEIELTDLDVEEIEYEGYQNPRLLEDFIDSVAPSIYGMRHIKKSMVFQWFGGIPKQRHDGTRSRGDIHVFLVGDPGTAKSEILEFQANLIPRSMMGSGLGSSAAGLTAAAVQEDGEWVLRAGVMVLADKGIACLDELDKMDKDDRTNIHRAMEQQRIPINKAGIIADLPSRCSVLAAANTKDGYLDPTKDLYEQFGKGIPRTLLSRFDLIWKIRDEARPDHDRKTARHILTGHMKHGTEEEHRGPYTPDFIRKYVAHARRTYFPRLTTAVVEKLEDYYEEIRGRHGLNVGARQLEGLIRLAEASARMHLRDKVTPEDADNAIEIFEETMRESALDPATGMWDAKQYTLGKKRSVIEMQAKVYSIIQDNMPEGIGMDDLLKVCKAEKIDRVETWVNNLREQGDIYVPDSTTGIMKTTRGG